MLLLNTPTTLRHRLSCLVLWRMTASISRHSLTRALYPPLYARGFNTGFLNRHGLDQARGLLSSGFFDAKPLFNILVSKSPELRRPIA